MTDSTQRSTTLAAIQSYIHTTEIFERPAAERSRSDTIDVANPRELFAPAG